MNTKTSKFAPIDRSEYRQMLDANFPASTFRIQPRRGRRGNIITVPVADLRRFYRQLLAAVAVSNNN